MGLLRELRSLPDEAFAEALREAQEGNQRAPKPKAKRGGGKRPKDSPVSRIAHVLRTKRGMSDAEAQAWLRDALQRDGTPAAAIPPPFEGPLEAWLDALLLSVRSSDAYAVAMDGLT